MNSSFGESVLAAWFRRMWNEGDITAATELASQDLVSHGLVQDVHGLDRWLEEFYRPMRARFSHHFVEVLEEFTCGDRIIARMQATFTPVGGTPATMHGTSIMRIENGKIAEGWDCWDFLSLLESRQLMPKNSFLLSVIGQLHAHPQSAAASA